MRPRSTRPRRARAGALGLVLALACAVPAPAATVAHGERLAAIETRLAALEGAEAARAVARDAEALGASLERDGASGLEARALRYAGIALMIAEDHGAALERFDRSAALCRAVDDYGCLGRALNNAAVALQGVDRLGEALARLRAASTAFAQAGDSELAGTTRFNAANIQLALGDAAGALAAYAEIERSYPGGKSSLGLSTNTAVALVELSRFAEADQATRRALDLAKDPVAREGYLADMRIVNLVTLARAAAGRGAHRRAIDALESARALSNGSDRDEFTVALGCLQVYAALDRLREAVPCAAAVERFQSVEEAGTRTRALALAAQAFAAAGDPARGYTLKQAAYTLVAEQRRAALADTTAAVAADVGLTERNALVDRIRRERQAERAAGERSRLLAAAMIGALLVALAGWALWARGEQHRRREAAVAADRLRVARELHDTALQGFAAVAMQLQAAARAATRAGDAVLAERLGGLASDAGASLAQARDAVWKVRSPLALAGGLAAAVEAWLASRRESLPKVDHRIDRAAERLRADQVEALLRVIQEAVANAANHGRAGTVTIATTAVAGGVQLEIADDGAGFVPAQAATLGGRWGLLGMRERIESLGGTLTIDSAPGAGTRIKAFVPA